MFFYACKRGREDEIFQADTYVNVCMIDLINVPAPQGVQLLDSKAMHQLPRVTWNLKGQVPLAQWLKEKPESDDNARLEAVGNVVFPLQARMGLHIIARQVMSRTRASR